MTSNLTRIERLRIEWTVWAFEFLLINMPHRLRVAKRREMRANLYAAAADAGTPEALRQLGSLRRLAAEYLDAQYGEHGRRPTFWRGITWMVLLLPIMFAIEDLGKWSFLDGVRAIPHATGVFHYTRLEFLGLDFTYRFVDGRNIGSRWLLTVTVTSLELIYMIAAFLIGARTWRLLASWRSWRLRRAAAISDH
jgi:hypothetical protein